MAQIFANNAANEVAIAGFAQSATTLPLTSAASFPDPGSDWYYVTIASGAPENAWEIVKVTAKSGNNLTVVRAQDGTSDVAWAAGSKVELRFTAETAALAATAVQPSSSEALSNKTLVAPVINAGYTEQSSTSVPSSITVSAGGQAKFALTANLSPTDELSNGQSVLWLVADGTGYTITWPTIVWAGGSAPTLPTTGYLPIEFVKIGSVLYGFTLLEVAS